MLRGDVVFCLEWVMGLGIRERGQAMLVVGGCCSNGKGSWG